jgi:hypothetical protein
VPSSECYSSEVAIGLGISVERQCEPPGEEASLHSVWVSELPELIGDEFGGAEHGHVRLAATPTRQQLGALGAKRRPRAPLLAEQPPGASGVLHGITSIARRQTCACCGEECVCANVRVCCVPSEQGRRLQRVSTSVLGHARRQQEPGTVEFELGIGRLDGLQKFFGRVVVAQCGGQLTSAIGDVTAVVTGHGGLELLTRVVHEFFASCKVPV